MKTFDIIKEEEFKHIKEEVIFCSLKDHCLNVQYLDFFYEKLNDLEKLLFNFSDIHSYAAFTKETDSSRKIKENVHQLIESYCRLRNEYVKLRIEEKENKNKRGKNES